jgi:hypothetical protein
MKRKQPQFAVDSVRRALRVETAQLSDHNQVLQPRKMRVELRFLRHVAHPLLVADQIVLDTLAVKQNLARRQLNQTGDHFHGRGFAGAVRPQVSRHLAHARRKRDVIDRGDAGEALRSVPQFKHGQTISTLTPGA